MDMAQSRPCRCINWLSPLLLSIIKAFTRGEIRHSEKFLRIFNEVPVLILISVVFLAVLKPF